MSTLFALNERGGITHAPSQRIGQTENRSEILADLRMTIDALGETCECQQKMRDDIYKLLDMLAPGESTNELRQQIQTDMETIDALNNFNQFVLLRVRGGTLKRFAELFDQ